MKRLLATLFLSIFISVFCSAQLSFTRVDTVKVIDQILPLNNAWAGGLNYPMFSEIDLNGDSIMDLIAFEPGSAPGNYRIMPFLNHGSAGSVDYHYAPEYISRFPPLSQWLTTYDYNCDGKMDLFSLSTACNCGIMLYRNDYNSLEGLKFTKVKDPLTYGNNVNIPANSISVPVMMDIDGDGDMDVLGWPVGISNFLELYDGRAVDLGVSCDSINFNYVSGCWGHFALNFSSNSANLNVACRVMSNPTDKMGWDRGTASPDDTQSCICLYDQDGNITKDALIGGYADNNIIYLHNGGTPATANMDYEDFTWPSYDVPLSLQSFPCTYNLDVNNDDKKDILVSPHSVNDFRGILYYKNMHVPTDTFVRQPGVFLQDEMIDVGSGAAPRLFDYDADGLPDLIIGDQSYHDVNDTDKKGLTVYKNIGTPSSPRFQLQTRDYVGINNDPGLSGNKSVGGLCPTFGDLNGDGSPDMIVGLGGGPTSIKGNGQLLYFQNTAPAGSPANFMLTAVFYDSIDVGSNAVPQLYDLDHDGLLDLVVGNSFGFIKYYRNLGSVTNPVFDRRVVKDTLGGIIVRYPGFSTGFASPFFYNDSGTDKLIVGTENGKVYIYDNVMNNIYGTYHLKDSLINGEEGQNLIPYIGDINNDGLPDMLIGNYNGGVSLFLNSFTTGTSPLPVVVLPSFNAYPNPATDELHLSFYHTEGLKARVEIVNSIGEEVYHAAVTEPSTAISLKNFSNGIYLVRFASDANTQSLKIVVRH